MEALKMFALNNFGTGGHPVATARNLDLFGEDYLRACFKRMWKARKRLSPRAIELIEEADAMIGWK